MKDREIIKLLQKKAPKLMKANKKTNKLRARLNKKLELYNGQINQDKVKGIGIFKNLFSRKPIRYKSLEKATKKINEIIDSFEKEKTNYLKALNDKHSKKGHDFLEETTDLKLSNYITLKLNHEPVNLEDSFKNIGSLRNPYTFRNTDTTTRYAVRYQNSGKNTPIRDEPEKTEGKKLNERLRLDKALENFYNTNNISKKQTKTAAQPIKPIRKKSSNDEILRQIRY